MFNLLTDSHYTRRFRVFNLQYSNSEYAVTKRNIQTLNIIFQFQFLHSKYETQHLNRHLYLNTSHSSSTVFAN